MMKDSRSDILREYIVEEMLMRAVSALARRASGVSWPASAAAEETAAAGEMKVVGGRWKS